MARRGAPKALDFSPRMVYNATYRLRRNQRCIPHVREQQQEELNMSSTTRKTHLLVGMAIFAALVVVLQLLASVIKIGTFNITLVLIPIVVGAAVYGPVAGMFLGGVFGAVVTLACITGADPGGAILWSANPFGTALVCMLKGMAAGWLAGLTYTAIAHRYTYLGVVAAAIICPVVNTGIFLLAMATIFRGTLVEWAGGSSLVYFVFIGLVGVNFLLELAINAVLSPIVVRIIHVGRKEAA